MGDPKKHRKTYQRPAILWQKERIEEEKTISQDYGLKNKKEIWKFSSLLKKYTGDAKKLISATSKQAEIEKMHLLKKLSGYGLVPENSRIEDVLNLKIQNFLDRRLQTLLVKLGYARTVKQARQFIVHQHVNVGDKLITSPSYITTLSEEAKISFNPGSSLFSEEHPERAIPEKIEPESKDKSKDKTPENVDGKKKESKKKPAKKGSEKKIKKESKEVTEEKPETKEEIKNKSKEKATEEEKDE